MNNIFLYGLIISLVFSVYSQIENSELKSKNEEIERDLVIEQEKNNILIKDINRIKKINLTFEEQNNKLRSETLDLNNKLYKLNDKMNRIALKHPQLLGKTITNASNKVNKCLENISKDLKCEE